MDRLARLEEFLEEILSILDEEGVRPIVYGSFAIRLQLEDEAIPVNDVDLLVPDRSLPVVAKLLSEKGIAYEYPAEWHTIKASKNDLRIELDSLEFWQGTIESEDKTINGKVVRTATVQGLLSAYGRAAETSKDKPEENKKKYEFLKQAYYDS